MQLYHLKNFRKRSFCCIKRPFTSRGIVCRNDFLSIEQIAYIHYLIIGTFACGEVKKKPEEEQHFRDAIGRIGRRDVPQLLKLINERWVKYGADKSWRKLRKRAAARAPFRCSQWMRERETESDCLPLYISYRWKSEIWLISQSHSRRCRCNYDYCPALAPAATLMKFSINRGDLRTLSERSAQRLPDLSVLQKHLRGQYESKLRIRTNWI